MDRLNLSDKTIAVFWSDHGYGTGEHGQWMKQTVFEAATRVPPIIAAPSPKSKGKGRPRTVKLADLYPTPAELCQLKNVPANLHGKSPRPLLDNRNASWDRSAMSQVARRQSIMGYSIRTERYRFTE